MPKQTRGVTLREPKDVRRICQRITSKAFQEGLELEYSGRIAQLMGVWLKAFELEKLADIERRLSALEEERRG
jgi:Zn-finger nucleic acid-binding protein